MNKILAICFMFIWSAAAFSVENKTGQYLGAQTSEIPRWFKESFLEFEEDVAEAAAQNKRVMIYFHQEGCPYCARLVDENFADPVIEAYVRKHFDGISINMWGDREIVTVGGKAFTEKTFSEALKVQYTPTILFLNESGQVVLRLNGYYPPQKFRKALQYVAEKQEGRLSYNDFMLASEVSKPGKLIAEDFFLAETDFQSLVGRDGQPLAIYFEATACDDCLTLHQQVLSDAPTRELVKQMNNVQVDVHSDQMIVTPDGQRLSQREYARRLNIGYAPSVVLFDKQGQEVHRIEGFLKTFHFQSSLAYVLEQAYLEQPSFQRYISARGEKLRELGFDTDIWGYQSFHPAE